MGLTFKIRALYDAMIRVQKASSAEVGVGRPNVEGRHLVISQSCRAPDERRSGGVRLREGEGKILINSRPLEDYFCTEQDRNTVRAPLEAVERLESFDVLIRCNGGGPTGQAGACQLGIARALCSYDTELYEKLREGGFLTRDARVKERKKPGLHGARRGTQFSKR